MSADTPVELDEILQGARRPMHVGVPERPQRHSFLEMTGDDRLDHNGGRSGSCAYRYSTCRRLTGVVRCQAQHRFTSRFHEVGSASQANS